MLNHYNTYNKNINKKQILINLIRLLKYVSEGDIEKNKYIENILGRPLETLNHCDNDEENIMNLINLLKYCSSYKNTNSNR